ncbi:hypothetical protein MHYP_G00203960 [Metynnis hypsauchen]
MAFPAWECWGLRLTAQRGIGVKTGCRICQPRRTVYPPGEKLLIPATLAHTLCIWHRPSVDTRSRMKWRSSQLPPPPFYLRPWALPASIREALEGGHTPLGITTAQG